MALACLRAAGLRRPVCAIFVLHKVTIVLKALLRSIRIMALALPPGSPLDNVNIQVLTTYVKCVLLFILSLEYGSFWDASWGFSER